MKTLYKMAFVYNAICYCYLNIMRYEKKID